MSSTGSSPSLSTTPRRSVRLNPETQDLRIYTEQGVELHAQASRRKGAQKTIAKATSDAVPQLVNPSTVQTYSPMALLRTVFKFAPYLNPILLTASVLMLGAFCGLLPLTRATFIASVEGSFIPLVALVSSDPSSLQIPLCTLPATNLVFPTCRSIPQPSASVGWDDYLQLVKVQGSWVTEVSHDTSHYPATLFRLSGLIHKVVYLAESYLVDPAGEPHAEAATRSIDLVGTDINATYEALRLYKDVNDMSTWMNYTSCSAIGAMNRVRSVSHSFAIHSLYPSEQWVVSRLFAAVREEMRSSFGRIAGDAVATKLVLTLLGENLDRFEDYVSRLCRPTHLNRAAPMLRLLHSPVFDGSQCRDLISGLSLARYDIEELLSAVHRVTSALADSARELSALEERVEQQAALHAEGVGAQYSGRHIVELLYQAKRVGSQKQDGKVVQLLDALLADMDSLRR